MVVLVGYGRMTIGWGYGWRWSGLFFILIASIFIKDYHLQYTNFLSLSNKESVTVIPVYTLKKKKEIKPVSVLTRLLCSLVSWCSLNWLNGWGRESIFDSSFWVMESIADHFEEQRLLLDMDKADSISICRSSHQRCSVTKRVLRNFAKFTGKHLSKSLFFKKLAALRPATLFKKGSGTDIFMSILRYF